MYLFEKSINALFGVMDYLYELAKMSMLRRPLLSMVVAAWNVAEYVDEFLESLEVQKVKPDDLEIIIVDDGSTDGTLNKLRKSALSSRYKFDIISHEHCGVSASRNAGINRAKGKWISFPDADDILDSDYLSQLTTEMKRSFFRRISVFVCRVKNLVELENGSIRTERHSLDSRFSTSLPPIIRVKKIQTRTVSMSSSSWFLTKSLRKRNLRFDTNLAIGEDILFTNKYLLYNMNTQIAFLSKPTYLYRKRRTKDSQVDLKRLEKNWLENPICQISGELFGIARRKYGYVPRFVQASIFYDLQWKIRRALADRVYMAQFTEVDRVRIFENWSEILKSIDDDLIEDFQCQGLTYKLRLGILFLFRGKNPTRAGIFVEKYDPTHGEFQFRLPTTPVLPTLCVNGKTLTSQERKDSSIVEVFLLGRLFYREEYFWLESGDFEPLNFSLLNVGNSVSTYISGKGTKIQPVNFGLHARSGLKPVELSNILHKKHRSVLAPARADNVSTPKIWLFVDRVEQASDSAEVMYRYVRKYHPQISPYFILSSKSDDWSRLKLEGFNLLRFGSIEHLQALAEAEVLMSSHVGWGVWPKEFGMYKNSFSFRMVFLQHGVIKDDLHSWLNTKQIDLFITSTRPEYQSIANPDSNYKFSSRDTVLTGLARFDDLWLYRDSSQRRILIAPTWRQNLSMPLKEGQSIPDLRIDEFKKSDFLKNWRDLINSSNLKDLSESLNLELTLAPHPNLYSAIHLFSPPKYISIYDTTQTVSYSKLVAESRLLLTDYSSIAFSAAYLNRRVVYFQFDSEEFYESHTGEKGYFSYQKDGFGPVRDSVPEAINAIREELETRESKYVERIQNTFVHQDGSNSERIFHEVGKIL
jgi:glycosyltransferase involved in cell wall biosynthesis/CDP-glycerol glycerophosphotransferase (TagB/SpsB family)